MGEKIKTTIRGATGPEAEKNLTGLLRLLLRLGREEMAEERRKQAADCSGDDQSKPGAAGQ